MYLQMSLTAEKRRKKLNQLRKSVPVSERQIGVLKGLIDKYPTRYKLTIATNVDSNVIHRIVQVKVCSEKTYRTLFPNDPLPKEDMA